MGKTEVKAVLSALLFTIGSERRSLKDKLVKFEFVLFLYVPWKRTVSLPTGAYGVTNSSKTSTESAAAALGITSEETSIGAIKIAINRFFICFTS